MESETSLFRSSSLLASRLVLFGRIFLVAYCTAIFTVLFPVKLLNPVWQLQACSVLLDNAALLLVSILSLNLGIYFSLDNAKTFAVERFTSYLSLIAVIVFLLLIPVQLGAGWQTYQTAVTRQQTQYSKAAELYEKFRNLVRSADNLSELQQSLKEIKAPPLNPDLLVKPLPQIKSQLLSMIDNLQATYQNKNNRVTPQSTSSLLQRLMIGVVTAFAYTIAFAASVQINHPQLSLLNRLTSSILSLPARLATLNKNIPVGKITSGKSSADLDYYAGLGQSQWFIENSTLLRKVIVDATSKDDLKKRLEEMNAPKLGARVLAKPFDELKKDLLAGLNDY